MPSLQLAGSIKTLAEESRSNTEMLIAVFREEGLYVRQLLQQHDARITRLEEPKRRIRFGVLKGKVTIAKDFDAPLPDAVLAGFEGR